ncbi:MAG TPA: hypothetical protein PLY26_02235, partial [Ferruginibacter sp.]|nr:hypothetical protein [Ferruginibacter sp.]
MLQNSRKFTTTNEQCRFTAILFITLISEAGNTFSCWLRLSCQEVKADKAKPKGGFQIVGVSP